MCDSCSTAISTESNPQDLKVLNHLVLSSVNGEVNKNVLIPNRMSVSSQSDSQTCLFGKGLFNHQDRACAKAFLDLGARKGLLPDASFVSRPDNIWHWAAI